VIVGVYALLSPKQQKTTKCLVFCPKLGQRQQMAFLPASLMHKYIISIPWTSSSNTFALFSKSSALYPWFCSAPSTQNSMLARHDFLLCFQGVSAPAYHILRALLDLKIVSSAHHVCFPLFYGIRKD
jgi:hypothetical protein